MSEPSEQSKDLKAYFSNIEANKALVKRYVELWSTGNLALADEVIAPNYVDHTHPSQAPGPEAVKQEVLAFRAGFPDAHIIIEQMIGEEDLVAFRFMLLGNPQVHLLVFHQQVKKPS